MSVRRLLVTVRDDAGHEHGLNATAFVGTEAYEEQLVGPLRRKLGPGQHLDSADADREHQRLIAAQVAYRAAELEWMAGRRDHPGSLTDYMP